jgi:hypothetical protein
VSAQDLYRHIGGIGGSGRLHGGVRSASGITVGWARRFLDERAESPAESAPLLSHCLLPDLAVPFQPP